MTTAVLLIDLQRDFLASDGARLPATPSGTRSVIQAANAVLQGIRLRDATPVVIVNSFPPSDTIMNTLRCHAAISGSRGAELDPRLNDTSHLRKFEKARSDAFSNPGLHDYLQSLRVDHLYVIGVMAEACVRATVNGALKHGYQVTVIADGVASTADWKVKAALWRMKRKGAAIARLDSIRLSPSMQARYAS